MRKPTVMIPDLKIDRDRDRVRSTKTALGDCFVFSKEIISNKKQMPKTNSEAIYESLESTGEMQLMMKFYLCESASC